MPEWVLVLEARPIVANTRLQPNGSIKLMKNRIISATFAAQVASDVIRDGVRSRVASRWGGRGRDIPMRYRPLTDAQHIGE